MPVISRFLGIIILMYWRDHNPPHFHAKYGDYEILVSLEGQIMEGRFPKRALRLVLEWMDMHRDELMLNWVKASHGEPLMAIPPLE